jgi:formate--tetrahydrofolate ligase
VHGGPFANIAHGCNSVIATQSALKLADYVVTEAGFGADLGAEKFISIKCRKAGLKVSACVIVATIRALKYHGGVNVADLNGENLDALKKGLVNLERHVSNVRDHYSLPAIVSINRFTNDTDAEIKLLTDRMQELGVKVVLATHWADGSKGAEELAHEVVKMAEAPSTQKFIYDDADTLIAKVEKIATQIYGAASVSIPAKIKQQLQKWQDEGYGHYPICVAKTQSSFSGDATLRGAPSGHVLNVREVRLNAGAQFIVMVCGDLMTMPGLPKIPSAEKIDVNEAGDVVGLF